MSIGTLAVFLGLYGLAAAYCGWCLCVAAKRGDEGFNRGPEDIEQ